MTNRLSSARTTAFLIQLLAIASAAGMMATMPVASGRMTPGLRFVAGIQGAIIKAGDHVATLTA